MILQPARIVLIDDNERHLKAISEALGQLGSASLSFQYQGDNPGPAIMAGARLVFCDLHLNSDAMTSDGKTECSQIVGMLDEAISDEHGPYLLIIWSQFPDKIGSLAEYLAEMPPGQRPFHHACLDKNNFIDVAQGTAIPNTDLPGEIQKTVADQPGLAAMLSWEQSAAKSAAQATNSLWKLSVETSKKNPDKALCKTLGKLAVGAAGPNFGSSMPGRSVLEALVPLLADQIEAQDLDEALWQVAVDIDGRSGGAASDALYTALHLEVPTSYGANKRGSASPVSALFDDDGFESFFGFSKEAVLADCGYREKDEEASTKKNPVWQTPAAAVSSAEWFLLQVNAACDEAQNHPGLFPFCLAFTMPRSVNNAKGWKDSVVKTKPVVLCDTSKDVFLLGRFIVGLPREMAEKLSPSFRIRTALLDQLVYNLRTNSARLGVTEPQ